MTTGDAAHGFILRFGNRPAHVRHVLRQPAVHLAIEVLDDLRPPLLPPLLRGLHRLAVVELQRVRQFRIGIALGFVVVSRIRRVRIAAIGALADRGDAELIHHQLVILLGGELERRWQIRRERGNGAWP